MSRRLDEDLAGWEAGALPLDDLRRLHPDDDVDALVGLHERFSALAAEPTPDPAAAWAALAPRLTDPGSARVRPRRRSRRAVVAAVIASALAVPTVSYAAAPDAVRSVARQVRDLLPGSSDDDVTPAHDRPDGTGSTDPDGADHDGSTSTTSTPAAPPTSAGSTPTDDGEAPDADSSDIDVPDTDAPDDSTDESPDPDTSTDGVEGSGDSSEADDAAVEADDTDASAAEGVDQVGGDSAEDPALAEVSPTDD